MAYNNNIVGPPKVDEITTGKIDELCNLILVNEDTLNFEECKKYIVEHIDNNIAFCGDRYGIRSIVQKRIAKYIKECPSLVQLFSFKSDNNFQRFRNDFHGYYYYYYYTKQGSPSPFVYPIEFEYVFDAIQEAIDFYVLYEQFSLKLEEEAVKRATEEATIASQKAVSDAKLAAKNAEEAANEAANKAVDSVIEQVVEKKRLEDKITNSVDEQMNRVTSKVSETSVTILGIFAGIVLTVVAGLFYSSSVLASLNSANYCRLISVASLVGFVCFSLIALMFRYIERIRYADKKDTPRFNKLTISISIILLCVMVVFGLLQFIIPDNENNGIHSERIDVDLSIYDAGDDISKDVFMDTDASTGENSENDDAIVDTQEETSNIEAKTIK